MPYTPGPVLEALGQAHNLASAPLPLDRIRARRMQREAAELEEYKADTQRINVNENVASGNEIRRINKNAEEYQKILTQELNNLPVIPANASPDDIMKFYIARMNAATSHWDPSIQKMGQEMAKNLPNVQKASPLDTNTMAGAEIESQNQRREDQTDIDQGNLGLRRQELQEKKRQYDNPLPSGFITVMNTKDTSQMKMVREKSPEADALAQQGWIKLTDFSAEPSILTDGGKSALMTGLMETEEQVTVLDGLIDRAKELAQKPGAIRGTAGEIANMFTSVVSQIGQVTGNPIIQNGIIEEEYLNPDPDRLSRSTRAALLNGQIDANTTAIAFMLALVNNPDGRISDADVRNSEKMIKSNQGSISVFLKSLDEVSRIGHIRLDAKRKVLEGHGVLPPQQEVQAPPDVPPEIWDEMTPAEKAAFQ